MNHSTGQPTKAEAERIGQMLELGCACAPCSANPEVHHITEGNRRLGHWWTLPICPGHHRGAWTDGQRDHYAGRLPPSISGGSRVFERHYGSQRELFMRTQARLGMSFSWPESKIIPRRVA